MNPLARHDLISESNSICPPLSSCASSPDTKIVFSYFDSKRDDATALQGAFSLGTTGCTGAFGGLGVDAVIGPASSGPSINAQYILRKLQIPQVGYSATTPALSDDTLFPYFVRTPPSDAIQAVVLAGVIKSFGWDQVATISGTDTYSFTGVQSFQAAAMRAGITVAGSQTFTADSKNVSREVSNLLSGGTRIVAVFTRASDMGTVMREFNRHNEWKRDTGVVYLFSETIKVGGE